MIGILRLYYPEKKLGNEFPSYKCRRAVHGKYSGLGGRYDSGQVPACRRKIITTRRSGSLPPAHMPAWHISFWVALKSDATKIF